MAESFFRRAAAIWARVVPDPRKRSLLSIAIRLAAIPCLMLICVWLYTQGLQGAVRLIPSDHSGSRFLVFVSLFAQDFLPACLLACVLCYPLALLYRRFAPVVALICCLPFIALWIFMNPYDSVTLVVGILAAYGQICLLVLVIAGTWLARLQLLRRAKAVEPSV